jgi:hypothetical protein
MSGNRQHRHVIAVTVEQSIDQMQVTGPAAAGTNREASGDSRLGSRGKARDLLMSHVHPCNVTQTTKTIVDPVQTVAGYPPDPLYAGIG